jgi:hypothetical protein
MIEVLEENLLRDLRTIPQNAFQDMFQNWKKRWKRCIDSGGEYFEGDKSYEVVSLSINALKRKFTFLLDRPRIHIYSVSTVIYKHSGKECML